MKSISRLIALSFDRAGQLCGPPTATGKVDPPRCKAAMATPWTVNMNLKADGAKLTGTVKRAATATTDISDGQGFDGDKRVVHGCTGIQRQPDQAKLQRQNWTGDAIPLHGDHGRRKTAAGQPRTFDAHRANYVTFLRGEFRQVERRQAQRLVESALFAQCRLLKQISGGSA